MSSLLLVGGIVWTILLGIWAYRLSAHDLYANRLWGGFWIAKRLLLRFGLGMALLWGIGASVAPPEPHYRILIVEAALPEAWEKADSLLRQRYAGIKTGLLAVKSSQAIWVVPPTDDPVLFRWVGQIRPRAALEVSEATPRYLTALNPYLPFARQIIWIGSRPPNSPLQNLHLLWCGKKSPPPGNLPVFFSVSSLPSPAIPLSEVQIALLLAGGCVLLLLLGDGLMGYILRQDLPLK